MLKTLSPCKKLCDRARFQGLHKTNPRLSKGSRLCQTRVSNHFLKRAELDTFVTGGWIQTECTGDRPAVRIGTGRSSCSAHLSESGSWHDWFVISLKDSSFRARTVCSVEWKSESLAGREPSPGQIGGSANGRLSKTGDAANRRFSHRGDCKLPGANSRRGESEGRKADL
jgi:hypothetical protein